MIALRAIIVFAALAGTTGVVHAQRTGVYGWAGGSSQLARGAPAGQTIARIASEAGEVIDVIDRRSDRVISQEITLRADASGQGENRIRVAIGPLNGGDEVLGPRIGPPLSSDISAELAREFPGVTMKVSEVMARNGYGPFGYATGVKGNRACLYAWQFIPKLGEGRSEMAFFKAAVSAALRIRLCRNRLAPEKLLEYASALVLAAPAATSYSYGEAGPPSFPAGGDALDAVLPGY
jgi:hypothetical protein